MNGTGPVGSLPEIHPELPPYHPMTFSFIRSYN